MVEKSNPEKERVTLNLSDRIKFGMFEVLFGIVGNSLFHRKSWFTSVTYGDILNVEDEFVSRVGVGFISLFLPVCVNYPLAMLLDLATNGDYDFEVLAQQDQTEVYVERRIEQNHFSDTDYHSPLIDKLRVMSDAVILFPYRLVANRGLVDGKNEATLRLENEIEYEISSTVAINGIKKQSETNSGVVVCEAGYIFESGTRLETPDQLLSKIANVSSGGIREIRYSTSVNDSNVRDLIVDPDAYCRGKIREFRVAVNNDEVIVNE